MFNNVCSTSQTLSTLVKKVGTLWPAQMFGLSDLPEVHMAHWTLYSCLLAFFTGLWVSVLCTNQTQAEWSMAGKVILLYIGDVSIISDRYNGRLKCLLYTCIMHG